MIYPERENIDRWFFDYFEGNLSPNQAEALEAFLEDNPDLIDDFHAWGDSNYEADSSLSSTFDRKDILLKKESRYSHAYLLYGIALILTSSLFLNKVVFTSKIEDDAKNLSSKLIENKRANIKNASHIKKLEKNENENKTKTFKTFTTASEGLKPTKHFELSENSLTSNSQVLKNPYISNNSLKPTTSTILNGKNNYLAGYINDEFVIHEEISLDKVKDFTSNQYEIRDIASTLPSLPINKAKLTDEADQSAVEYNEGILVRDELNFQLNPIKFSNLTKIISNLSTGLTYIPDITYALPEMSQADVMISNTGAISQTRFQQTATARWFDESNQRKISNQISFDTYSRNARMGVGIQLNHHLFGNGAISQLDGAFTISPKIAMTRNISIEPAARMRFGSYQVNTDRIMNYNNQYVQYETGEQQLVNFDTTSTIGHQLIFRDLDAGLTLNSTRGYIGFQANNITGHFNDIFSNQENNYQHAKLKLSGIIGTQFLSLNHNLSFSPYAYTVYKSGNMNSFVGFSAHIYGLKIGASYNSLNQTIQLGYQSKRFGLMAQSSMQRMFNQTKFTHQLSMRINTETSKKIRRYITL